MNLILRKTGLEIENIEMDNKPVMAIALENDKIRDFSEELRNSNTQDLVIHLLNLLGVSGKQDPNHHIEAAKFINLSLGKYTYQEILLAFQMYVSGDFKDERGLQVLVTQQINAVVIGRVMRCYSEIKKNNLDQYRKKKELNSRNEMSQEEKDLLYIAPLISRFDQYKENKGGLKEVNHIYDDFIDKKIIKPYISAKGYYNKKYHEARENLISHYTNLKYSSLEERRESDGILLKLHANTSPLINKSVKDMVVTSYFNSLDCKGIDLRDVLIVHYPNCKLLNSNEEKEVSLIEKDEKTLKEVLKKHTESNLITVKQMSLMFSRAKSMSDNDLKLFLSENDCSGGFLIEKFFEIVEKEIDKRNRI